MEQRLRPENRKRKSRPDELSLLRGLFRRDYAADLCMRMHNECKRRGDARSKRRCINVVNKKIIGPDQKKKLYFGKLARTLARPTALKQTMTTSGRTDKTTYIYFQKASGDHSLRQGVKEHRKERDVLPVEDVQYISAQLNLLPMRRGMYCMRSLNKTPHGGALLSDKISNDCLVEKQKIENATIVHGGQRGELDLTK